MKTIENKNMTALQGFFVLAFALVLAGPMVISNPAVQAKGQPCMGGVDVTFRDGTFYEGEDRVRSDGLGTYFDCANITSDHLFFRTADGRTVIFDLTQPADANSPSLGRVQVETNLGVEIAGPDGLPGMEVGEIQPTTKVQFNFVVGSTRYFLQWGSNYNTDVADVTRTGPDTWTIEASRTDKARVQSCAAKGKCNLKTVGFYEVPFQMTAQQ